MDAELYQVLSERYQFSEPWQSLFSVVWFALQFFKVILAAIGEPKELA